MKHLSSSTKVLPKVLPTVSQLFGWTVAGSYRIEIHKSGRKDFRVVVPDRTVAGIRSCRPGMELRLLEDFAAATKEAGLLDFTRRYGPIAYHRMYPNLEQFGEGDPVIWAIAHARIIAGGLDVIEIVNEVQNGRLALDGRACKAVGDAFARVFRNIGFEGPNEDPQPGTVTFSYLRPEALGDARLRGTTWVWNWEADPVGGAYKLLAWLINPMIRGVHYELQMPDSWPDASLGKMDNLKLDLNFNALLEVIYWLLASRVGGKFRHCQRCGRTFPGKGRQIFCSDSCMNKSKCERYRQQVKKSKRRKRRRR